MKISFLDIAIKKDSVFRLKIMTVGINPNHIIPWGERSLLAIDFKYGIIYFDILFLQFNFYIR
jgi:hypothetical protein